MRMKTKSYTRFTIYFILLVSYVVLLTSCEDSNGTRIFSLEELWYIEEVNLDSVFQYAQQQEIFLEQLFYSIDSLNKQYPERAHKLAKKALEVSLDREDQFNEAKARYWLGFHYGKFFDTYQKGITESLKSVELFARLGDSFWKVKALELTASNFFMGDVEDSSFYYLDLAKKSIEDINDRSEDSIKVLAEVMDTYAWIYEFKPDGIDSVIKFENESISLFESIGDMASATDGELFLATVIGDAGEDKKDIRLLNSAEKHFARAIRVFDSLNYKRELGYSYYYLGRWHMQRYNLTGSEPFFEKGLASFRKSVLTDSSLSCDVYTNLGFSYFKKQLLDKTISEEIRKSYRDSAIFYFSKVLDPDILKQNRTCIDNIVPYLDSLCALNNYTSCDNIINELAKNYQALHLEDLDKLYSEQQEIERFRKAQRKQEAEEQKRQRFFVVGFGLFFILVSSWILISTQKLTYFKRELFIKRQALRAQLNPHFIANCLSAIEYLIHDNKPRIAADYLIDFGRLCRNVIANSRKESITLKEEIETIRYFLTLERLRLSDKLSFEIKIENQLENSLIDVPPMIMQPYVENSVWHGISPKPNGGHIKILIKRDSNDKLIYVIEDDGIGREESLERKKQSVISRKSWGMEIMKDRYQALSDTFGVEEHIVDLFDQEGKAEGTKVILTINLSNRKSKLGKE